ncbi:adenylate/guanylate cyclase domain-containing protein [Algivirga pacifica]|uniref:Guanylate cyclase domain-containing protein n=1 Tax=Algivirga pacifica TaxID=1162670 RepID=A0ABP9D0J1_9BACT
MYLSKKRTLWLGLISDILLWLGIVHLFRWVRYTGMIPLPPFSFEAFEEVSFWLSHYLGILMGLLFWSISKVSRTITYQYNLCYAHLILLKSLTGVSSLLIIGVFSIALIIAIFYPHMPLNTLFKSNFQLTVIAFLMYAGCWWVVLTIIEQLWNRLGPEMMFNLVTGKYQNPTEEERIFMFIDLNHSTTLAEQLGHTRYSQFLQDYYKDLHRSIEKHRASIYQYVGDEIVLTWKKQEGIKQQRYVRLFFDIQTTIQKRQAYYLSHYQHIPSFKAAANVGMVTVAEIGILRKEIAYHSDVLNTASRLITQCDILQENFLITEELKTLTPDLNSRAKGSIQVKGKMEKVSVYALS